MKEKAKRIYYIFAALFALVITIISGQAKLSAFLLTVGAEETTIEYTSPLEDLEKNEKFDKSLYPIKANDYSLSVITVAESENLQLFVYVYQPSYSVKSLIASSINISCELHNRLSFKNYKMVLLSQDGVFQKYAVDGLIVNSDEIRYYEISSIFRVWDSTIDQGIEATNDNTIDEVSFEVAKQYKFFTENGILQTTVSDTEVIRITDKFVGFVRYSAGFKLYNGSCDSHFVAFSTDKPIDKLYEADIYYTTQSYSSVTAMGIGTVVKYGDDDPETTDDIKENYAYINSTQGFSYNGGGWGAETYLRDRIQTTSEFIEDEQFTNTYQCGIFDISAKTDLTETAKENIKNKQWVLRFAETSYVHSPVANNSVNSTIVGDVTILRLLFETDGVVYNLGVVDNKQTGSTTPANKTEVTIEYVDDWVSKLVALILVVVLFAFFWPYLVPLILSVFKMIIKGVKNVIKIAFFIVTIPLRLIGWIFKKK